ncbi:unnamed protein product, partial [Staurois parvus]
METAAMGGRTGTHDRLWTWQQHEEEAKWHMAAECVAMETAAMGGRTGTMTDSGLGSSMRRRYIGAHGRLGAWQQLWEAVYRAHGRLGAWQQLLGG